MPLTVVEAPPAVRRAAAEHVHQLATPRGVFPALRDVIREELVLLAPHRMYTAELTALLDSGLAGATQTGWRLLVADRDRIVASVELADDEGQAPLLNSGPYVASTASAIDEIEALPEVTAADFEFRLLKVPALHVVAAWLAGAQQLVVPLAPVPGFLEAGREYTEEDFLATLREPAGHVLAAEAPSGG